MTHTPSNRGPLASLALCMLLPSLATSIANVALPTLADSFAVSFHQVQWVVLAFLLAQTGLIVTAGRLGDVLGRQRLLLAGVALFTVASALCGLAPSLWFLIAARAVQGLGAALMMALAMALVTETVPRQNAGAAMGLLGTTSAIGTALGPSLGGLLIAGLGWRWIFLALVPLGVTALLAARRYLPAAPAAPQVARPGFDLAGTLLANLRDPQLRAGLAMSTLVSTVLMATLVVGPFYLSGVLGFGTALVGLVMSIGPIVAALAGAPSGKLVDSFGTQRARRAGLIAVAAGCLALSLFPPAFGIAGYVAPIVLITAGYALFQAANNTAVMTGVAADQRGTVSGLLNLSRNLGLITGASAMGALYSQGSGLRLTFAVATLLVGLALAIAVTRRTSPTLRCVP